MKIELNLFGLNVIIDIYLEKLNKLFFVDIKPKLIGNFEIRIDF